MIHDNTNIDIDTQLLRFEYGTGMYDKVEYIEDINGGNIDIYHLYNSIFSRDSNVLLFTGVTQTFTSSTAVNYNRSHQSGYGDPKRNHNYETLGYNVNTHINSQFDNRSEVWSFIAEHNHDGYYGAHKMSSDANYGLIDTTYSNNTQRVSHDFSNDTYATVTAFNTYKSSQGYECADFGQEGGREWHFHYAGGWDYAPVGGNGDSNTATDFKTNFTQTNYSFGGSLGDVSIHGQGCELNNTEYCYIGGEYVYDDSVYPTHQVVHKYNTENETWDRTVNFSAGTFGSCVKFGEDKMLFYHSDGANFSMYDNVTRVRTEGHAISGPSHAPACSYTN